MKKIVAISDLHGKLPVIKGVVDYLLIAGDIVPLRIQTYSRDSKEWLRGTFAPWIDSLGVREKAIIVAGNHDFYAENHGNEVRDILGAKGIVYLCNQFWSDETIEVYGTPLCKPFGSWAFMRPIEDQRKIFTEAVFQHNTPVSILLSHDSPYGVSDVILQEDCMWADGSHIGNRALTELVEREQPTYMLHGHLHSTNHEVEMLGETYVQCVSILDESYTEFYEPTYIEIDV